jgi:beta-glucanase (GH16 family)
MHPGKAKKGEGFEIDVNEGHYPDVVNMTLHQDGLPSNSESWHAGMDLSKDFHVYAVAWNEKELTYYFDGREVDRKPNAKAHLEVPVMFSTAVITWAGPVTDALDGKSMDVDWVRVYRRKDER